MTYHWTDPDGDRLEIRPGPAAIKLDALDATTHHRVIVTIPLDRLEEFIAGARETGRQAARQEQPTWSRHGGFDQHDDYQETVS